MRRVLLLDLDGTLCLGDEPARFYARRIAELAADVEGAAGIPEALEEFLHADPPLETSGASPRAEDGYMTVWTSALALGVPQGTVSAAFLDTRAGVVSGSIPTHAPEGAAELLAELGGQGVHRVLATNSPGLGLDGLLERLGLLPQLDTVIPDAGKPAGLAAIAAPLQAKVADPSHLLSVGDIWVNDLAPIQALGGRTAHLDRHGLGTGTPDLRAPSFADLYPELRAWAR